MTCAAWIVPLSAALCLVGMSSRVDAHGSGPASGSGHSHSAPGADGKGGNRKGPSLALAVSAVFGADGRLWLLGVNERNQLALRISEDDGRSWGLPRVLDTGSDVIAAVGENRPKLAFGPNSWVVITYTQPLARPYTGEIRMLRSEDGGRTFSAPFTVHRDRQLITHRFESIAFDARGVLHTLWIDKRDAEAARAAGVAGGDRGTKPLVVTYAGAAVYRNESADGGRTFGPDTRLADHSCECCRIALAPDRDGGLVALWRHVFGNNVRDHAFSKVDARAQVVRASFDEWTIDACPHHGPGLAVADDGGYHAVWFGERDGSGAVRYGRLTANGEPQGTVRELPDEAAEHADVASSGRQVVIVWRSFDGKSTALRAWISGDGGATFALRELGKTSEENDHPRLARKGAQIYAVWRTANEIKVERVAQ